MNDKLRLYEHDAEDFSGNGIATLIEATDVTEKQSVNGEATLEFTMPKSEKKRLVTEERVVSVAGRRYRIKTIDGDKITATAIYNDAAYKHIQYLPDMMGQAPRNIMNIMFKNTAVHIMTDDEVKALGMEWVTDKTDFFAVGKTTPLAALNTMMETLDKYKIHSELYIDNYNIALVKQIGRDRGVRVDEAYNAKGLTIKKDTTSLITRLYPYGKEDLHIGSYTADDKPQGQQYIDSPNYTKWQREGYEDFDTLTEPQEIYAAAKTLFDEDNPDRIDVPKYSITVEYASRGEDIRLGDIVTVNDRENGIKSKQRVISIEYHPFEPEKNTVEVGNPPVSLQTVFNGLIDTNTEYRRTTNSKGETKTKWLECMQGNKSVIINKAIGKQDIALYETGALFEAPDGNAAVAIIDGNLAIANTKDADNQWKWTSIMDGGKVLVNSVYTGILYTEAVKLMGDGASLKIDNNLITFTDKKGKLRSRWGVDDNGVYMFEMYSADGQTKSFYIDENGNLTMQGVFKTGSDGEARVVIDDGGIVMYNADDEIDGVSIMAEDKYGARFSVYNKGKRILAVAGANNSESDYLCIYAPRRGFEGTRLDLVPCFVVDGGMIQFGIFTLDLDNCNINYTKKHNHGIPDGTKLMTSGGGYVEWTASSPFV